MTAASDQLFHLLTAQKKRRFAAALFMFRAM
jgi:hypothetical protein